MFDELLRSLRTLFMGTVLVLVLWLVTVPRAIDLFRVYNDLKHVHAWFLLHQTLDQVVDKVHCDDFFEEPTDDILTMWILHIPADPRGHGDAILFEVAANWPVAEKQKFKLVPELQLCGPERTGQPIEPDTVWSYRVESSTAILPLAQYRVVFIRSRGSWGELVVMPADDTFFESYKYAGLARILLYIPGSDKPRHWDRILLYLTGQGFEGTEQSLTLTHPALSKLRAQADPRSPESAITVLGIRLTISSFFSSVGFLLAALAFAMLGPLSSLGASRTSLTTHPWIFALPIGRGLRRWFLENIITLVTLIWALAPLAILAVQWFSGVDATEGSEWWIRISYVCLFFSSLVFLSVARELRRLRVASRLTEHGPVA